MIAIAVQLKHLVQLMKVTVTVPLNAKETLSVAPTTVPPPRGASGTHRMTAVNPSKKMWRKSNQFTLLQVHVEPPLQGGWGPLHPQLRLPELGLVHLRQRQVSRQDLLPCQVAHCKRRQIMSVFNLLTPTPTRSTSPQSTPPFIPVLPWCNTISPSVRGMPLSFQYQSSAAVWWKFTKRTYQYALINYTHTNFISKLMDLVRYLE